MFGNPMEIGILSALVIPVLVFYFVPTIIALARKQPSKNAIIALNILAGWSVFGWVAALIWALLPAKETSVV